MRAFARDTVSSIGILRGSPLPLTTSAEHICCFRHALALDECRVKFIPECVVIPSRPTTGDAQSLSFKDKSSRADSQHTMKAADGVVKRDANGKAHGSATSNAKEDESQDDLDMPKNSKDRSRLVEGGEPANLVTRRSLEPVKEVWFAGSHSDMYAVSFLA